MSEDIVLREARPGDAALLTALAMRSKASWGYEADFMDACQAELTITEARIGRETMRVAEWRGELAGFASLVVEGETAELVDLFVEPAYFGRGVARCLLDDVMATARRLGAVRLRVEADPNAAPTYRRFGFHCVGEVPSGSIPGRALPLMERALPA